MKNDFKQTPVAQGKEQRTSNPQVAGSIPARSAFMFNGVQYYFKGESWKK